MRQRRAHARARGLDVIAAVQPAAAHRPPGSIEAALTCLLYETIRLDVTAAGDENALRPAPLKESPV